MTEQGITQDIYLTKDYGRFDFYSQNRIPTDRHVERMKKSLEEFGFLPEHPITVIDEGGKLKITDGQHRFLAAKKLELPVYYVISKSADAAQDIIIKHLYSKTWAMEDFLHHYTSLRVKDYLTLSLNSAKSFSCN